jgi:hypothetical protein
MQEWSTATSDIPIAILYRALRRSQEQGTAFGISFARTRKEERNRRRGPPESPREETLWDGSAGAGAARRSWNNRTLIRITMSAPSAA